MFLRSHHLPNSWMTMAMIDERNRLKHISGASNCALLEAGRGNRTEILEIHGVF